MKKSTLFTCLLFLHALTWSQGNIGAVNFKNQTNVFPPSPNAAALAKYAEIPVNTHTGIPSISVPIHQWKSRRGGASVSVGLSYHAGGVKVEDVASNVGTGWALNAGGVITRSVRGLADDDVYGYINTPVIADFNTYRNDGGYYLYNYYLDSSLEYSTCDTARSNIIGWFNNPAGDMNALNMLYRGGLYGEGRDTEQDLFFYNIEGLSGKFVLDKDGAVNKIDQNALEIAVQYSISGSIKEILSFTIQADNGIKYLFDYRESSRITTMTHSFDYDTTGGNYRIPSFSTQVINTAYYVSKAVDLNSHDTVLYQYGASTVKYMGGWNESQTYHDNDQPKVYYSTGNFSGYSTDQKINNHSYSFTCTVNSTYNIRKILLPDGSYLDFYYDEERRDVSGDSALTRIEVTDITGAFKKYRIKYGYIDSYIPRPPVHAMNGYPISQFSGAPWYYTPTDDHFFTRLRLDTVHQMTAWTGGDSLLLYAFEYNDTVLPPRNSKAIDFWGYYYGPERDAGTLIPQVYPAVPETVGSEGIQSGPGPVAALLNIFTEGADRTPNSLYTKASVLKKISLPTGGHTSFRFRTNSVRDTIYYNSNTRYIRNESSPTSPGTRVVMNLEDRTDTKVIFYISYKRTNSDGSLYVPPSPDGPLSCLANAVSSGLTIAFNVQSTDGTVGKYCVFNGLDSGEASYRVYFDLPLNKSYKFYYHYFSAGGACLDDAYFVMNTNIKYFITNTDNLVGGLRVEAIDHYDPMTDKSMRTVYDYRNDDGYVSGIIPIVPNHNYHVNAIGEWSCCGFSGPGGCVSLTGTPLFPYFLGYAKYKTRTSSSTQTLGYAFGSNAGYTKVSASKVDIATGATLGRTVERFTGSVIKNYREFFPYMTTQQLDWKSGQKWEETFYDASGTLQKRISLGYDNVVDSSYNDKNRSIRLACIRTEDCAETQTVVSPIQFQRFVAHSSYPYHGRSLLTSKRETEFSGTDSLVRTSTYFYGYNDYLVTETTDNSIGLNTTKTYHYPIEYTHAAMQQLVTNKVVNVPVASRTTQKQPGTSGLGNELQGEGADYAIDGSFARPNLFYQRANTDPTVHGTFSTSYVKRDIDELVGEITAYDSYGNVAEFKGRDGIPVAVIWGYRGTMPVAKVIGATYADAVSKLSSISYANLQLLTSESTLRTKLDEIRQGYSSNPLVQVTSSTSKPLIGVTSETDANGRTIYYEYDSFHRLKLVKDKDGNIIKAFDYKYQANP